MKKLYIIISMVIICGIIFTACSNTSKANHYDIVIYGGTSSGVIAAIQAKKMGNSVAIVGPDVHLGGLTSGGLGWTDGGNTSAVGGLAREFYHRVWQHYDKNEAWVWEKKQDFANQGQGTRAKNDKEQTMWVFEPHVAEMVYDEWVKELDIPVLRDEWLDRESGVKTENGEIKAITMLSGKTFTAQVFIDATYEGDLMAAANVSYHVGREANSIYDETWNGVQVGILHHRHHFQTDISPYKVPGDPASGVLPRISADTPGKRGDGDHRLQAYCYRMCLTTVEKNRVSFPKPENYNPAQYELLVRVYESGWRETFQKFDMIPNLKTDTNNHGPFSTDNIGMNYDYPEASYERRKKILKEHENYQKGWLYFIANNPRVPQEVQQKMQKWGLAKDEFVDNGNWPHQIYVREARRMIGVHVMTEHDVLGKSTVEKPVGMGSYTLDSHNAQRYIKPDGFVQNEGDIGVHVPGPYRISYNSIIPKKQECANLLVPVCVSSSHIAFGSIRMEPVFMILGQSAATAASFAIENNTAVQDVDYEQLKTRLIEDKQRF